MDLIANIHQIRLQEWAVTHALWEQTLFTYQWWTLLILVATTYVVWWKLADKIRLSQLLLFGAFVTVVRVIVDDVVLGAGLYAYKVRLIPLSRNLILNDLTIVPLMYMVVHQFNSTWKRFFFWSMVWSGIWAFTFMPLFVSLGVMIFYDWKYYYTFIEILVIGVFSRFVFLLVTRVEHGETVLQSVSIEARSILQPAMKPLNKEHDDEHREKKT